MSSVNPHYTFEYSQPEAYRFSHDSVFLARKVFEMYRPEELPPLKALDLCAGCGIVGLDFIFHCKNTWGVAPQTFDFLEIQEIYKAHFDENRQRLGNISTKINFLNQNYDQLASPFQYDLILCNPPYFRLGQGKLSPSEFKNRCRFFIDADFISLIKAIQRSLTPNGKAYVLLKNLEEHGWNPLLEARHVLNSLTEIRKIGEIRGTDLVLISHLPGNN